MAITKPLRRTEEDFISNAPDAKNSLPIKGVRKGNKQQISLTIKPDLLEKIDHLSDELGLSRAALINLAVSRAIDQGLVIDAFKPR